MLFNEAIMKGLARVDRWGQRALFDDEYVRDTDGRIVYDGDYAMTTGETEACALGAAYLAIDDSADPRQIMSQNQYNAIYFVMEAALTGQVFEKMDGTVPSVTSRITEINDSEHHFKIEDVLADLKQEGLDEIELDLEAARQTQRNLIDTAALAVVV